MKKVVSYKDILADIQKGNFAPIYILMGEETYYIDLITDALEESVVAGDDRIFNNHVFYGADTELEEVMGVGRQFPMAERQLVMLKEAQSVKGGKRTMEKLESYFAAPGERTVFVVAYKGDTLNLNSKVVKAAEKAGGVIFKSSLLGENQVGYPIREYCRKINIKIEDNALLLLVNLAGTSLSKLFKEIDKLSIAAGRTRVITEETVAETIGQSKEFTNFELVRAISVGDFTKAMRIVDRFASDPKHHQTNYTLGFVFSFYQKLAVAWLTTDRTETGLMKALDAKSPYALREIYAGMRHISFRKTMRCISALRDFDTASKGIDSARNEHDLFKELIFKLFTFPA